MWKGIGALAISGVHDVFQVQGYPEKWRPLSTIWGRKRGKTENAMILMNTAGSGLMGSIQEKEVTNNSVTIGSDLIYAPTHEFGRPSIVATYHTAFGREVKPYQRNMPPIPQRSYMHLTPRFVTEIETYVSKFIMTGVT